MSPVSHLHDPGTELVPRLPTPDRPVYSQCIPPLACNLIQVLILLSIVYFMAGFPGDRFGFVLLVFLMGYFAVDAVLAWISVVAPGHEAANVAASLTFTIFLLFNGFTSNTGHSPWWIIWLQYLSPCYYTFTATAASLFMDHCCYPWDCRATVTAIRFPALCVAGQGGLSDQYGLSASFRWPAVAILAAFAVVFWGLAVVCQVRCVRLRK